MTSDDVRGVGGSGPRSGAQPLREMANCLTSRGGVLTTKDDTELIPEGLDLKVLTRLAAGQHYETIAAAEYLSSRTVCRMVRNLKQRTGVNSVAALCAEATRRGWVPSQEQTRNGRHADVPEAAVQPEQAMQPT